MKSLKILGIIFLALTVLIGVLGIVAPKSFDLERQITIQATKEVVFPHVQYLEKHDAWSPWREMDTDMQTTLSGTDGMVGTSASWEGVKAGTGSQTLTLVQPYNRVETKIHFIKPFKSNAEAYFQLTDAGNGATQVAWGFRSPMPFPFNIMGLFMNMEQAVGKDYEKGLAKLKALVEKEAQSVVPTWEVKEIILDAPRFYIGVRSTIAMADISRFLAENLPQIATALETTKLEIAGAPSTLTFAWNETEQTTDLAAVIPVKSKIALKGFSTFEYPAGPSLSVDYYGPYDKIGSAHQAIETHIARKAWAQGTPVWEEYLTDPGLEPDPAKWLTRVYAPVEAVSQQVKKQK